LSSRGVHKIVIFLSCGGGRFAPPGTGAEPRHHNALRGMRALFPACLEAAPPYHRAGLIKDGSPIESFPTRLPIFWQVPLGIFKCPNAPGSYTPKTRHAKAGQIRDSRKAIAAVATVIPGDREMVGRGHRCEREPGADLPQLAPTK